VIDATDCLVVPGLVNTHHHIYQNLTRAYPPMTTSRCSAGCSRCTRCGEAIDEEAVYASAFVGLAELALSGCTTSTDHLYLHPRGGGDLLSAEIAAARELGMRFHPTRGSMSLSEKDGGLPPDDVVRRRRDPRRQRGRCTATTIAATGAMVRIALAPCSPFSVTEQLMVAAPSSPNSLDVRLHTHFAENAEDDEFSSPPSAAGRWSTSSAPAGAPTAPGSRTA
jgi:cytosine/adenosine deaminase-related metal-dependent hydrolase